MLVLDVFVGVPNAQNKPVFVQPEIAGIHSGDDVLWRIFSLDSKISHVEIEFDDPADEFFPSNTNATRSKKCHARLSGDGSAKQGTIHGDAPRPGTKSGEKSVGKPSKYTVRAYSQAPQDGVTAVAIDDPIIVTVDP
jgi:hypothetical protein